MARRVVYDGFGRRWTADGSSKSHGGAESVFTSVHQWLEMVWGHAAPARADGEILTTEGTEGLLVFGGGAEIEPLMDTDEH